MSVASRTSLFLMLAAALALSGPHAARAAERSRLFFLHHSTGRNLINEGNVRALLTARNGEQGTSFVLWDHDYNHIGLRNADGVLLGRSYNIPGDNTDPDGLHVLWTTANAARDSILANHQVIAFKSCYPASGIDSDTRLQQYKTWYLEMRAVFAAWPNRVFVIMSPPPLHRLATNTAQADRARAFAEWLGSAEFLGGTSNLVYFDFFDLLARPDDGSPTRNMLRYEYERSHTQNDSHPNTLANQVVGPLFCEALAVAGGRVAADSATLGAVKAMFR